MPECSLSHAGFVHVRRSDPTPSAIAQRRLPRCRDSCTLQSMPGVTVTRRSDEGSRQGCASSHLVLRERVVSPEVAADVVAKTFAAALLALRVGALAPERVGRSLPVLRFRADGAG